MDQISGKDPVKFKLFGSGLFKPNKIFTFQRDDEGWWELPPTLKSHDEPIKICGQFELAILGHYFFTILKVWEFTCNKYVPET